MRVSVRERDPFSRDEQHAQDTHLFLMEYILLAGCPAGPVGGQMGVVPGGQLGVPPTGPAGGQLGVVPGGQLGVVPGGQLGVVPVGLWAGRHQKKFKQ